MSRAVAFFVALSLGGGMACLAEDPPAPAKEKAQTRPANRPKGFVDWTKLKDSAGRSTAMAWATSLIGHEAAVQVLQAQLETKEAHIKAAEVSVKAAKLKLDVLKTGSPGAPKALDLVLAKNEVEAAEAQLGIRRAEAKEIVVRIKYSKKRFEEVLNEFDEAMIRANRLRVPPVPAAPAAPRRFQ